MEPFSTGQGRRPLFFSKLSDMMAPSGVAVKTLFGLLVVGLVAELEFEFEAAELASFFFAQLLLPFPCGSRPLLHRAIFGRPWP
jgi:hypothetical protein